MMITEGGTDLVGRLQTSISELDLWKMVRFGMVDGGGNWEELCNYSKKGKEVRMEESCPVSARAPW